VIIRRCSYEYPSLTEADLKAKIHSAYPSFESVGCVRGVVVGYVCAVSRVTSVCVDVDVYVYVYVPHPHVSRGWLTGGAWKDTMNRSTKSSQRT
jgi:hypothetical protein